jgi:hypothetical protein
MSRKSTSKFATAAVVCLSATLGAGSAAAQSASPAQALLDNNWVFNLGAFVVGTDLKASLNGRSTNNPEIDFDETLGAADDTTRVRGDVLWRINPVHHLRFSYFNNTIERSKIIDRDIAWGDYTFKADGQVDSRHEMEVYELAYEYAFMKQPTYEVAAIIGLHYTETKLQLSGNATVILPDGSTSIAEPTVRTNSLAAPLPVIGLRGAWVVAPQWLVEASGQYFGLDYEGVDGSWSDLRASATWMFNRNFGLGLGYNRFSMRVDASKNDFNGRLKTSYGGLQAFLTGTF